MVAVCADSGSSQYAKMGQNNITIAVSASSGVVRWTIKDSSQSPSDLFEAADALNAQLVRHGHMM